MKKAPLRSQMKAIRSSLSSIRRRKGEKDLFDYLGKKLKDFKLVLSFSSIHDEICVDLLNQILHVNRQLLLPKIDGNTLKAYRVKNLSTDLKSSTFNLLEPDPLICHEISLDKIDCILIPALAFDTTKNRLGYGKGFYDRLLSQTRAHFIGVGFKEQLLETLPTELHDQKVNEILLF